MEPGYTLTHTEHSGITYSDKIDIINMVYSIWPPKDGIVRSAEEQISRFFADRPEEKHIVVKHEQTVCGYARTFLREIFIGDTAYRNCALACVCVKETLRRSGLGRAIVRTAFDLVDIKKYDCSLFQTAVPDFYTKLGAKVISNHCFDSCNGNVNPWWDNFVMLYPSTFDCNDYRIDLKGKGY